MRVPSVARIHYWPPEDFSSRLLIGAIIFLGSAILVGTLLAPILFPGRFGVDGLDAGYFLLPW